MLLRMLEFTSWMTSTTHWQRRASFSKGVGLLEGKYHIQIDPGIEPVQHAPRQPVAIREQLRDTLEELLHQGIVKPVTQPTRGVSSMVVIPKKDGSLCVCLDPKDLNQAIPWDYYPLPTIEDIATCLHGAKLFTTLDAYQGLWHIDLDEESLLLTTFNSPFGRYCMKRMPFGISSAPEVLQCRMHELVEDLEVVKVVAVDFLVVGLGDIPEGVSKSHDDVLRAFLQRCEGKILKLNNDKKIKLQKTEVHS